MKKYLIVLCLIALFISGCLRIETGDDPIHTVLRPPSPVPAKESTELPQAETEEEAVQPETTEPDAKITISAVGDIIGSTENYQSVKTGDVYEFSGQFRELREMFLSHDLTIANLVSPIAGADYGYSGYPRYNAPRELVQAIADIGIDALSTANRYAFDLGARAVNSNLNNIQEIGLRAFGTAANQEQADQPLILDVGGIKVGLASYTSLLNQPLGNVSYAVSMADPQTIEQDITKLRSQGAEIISVNMYWGDEYADHPNAEQTELMDLLERLGVDIVLGSHPHVIQPLVVKTIEFEGRQKTMVQAYSLGNFYSAFLMGRTKTGLMLAIDVAREAGLPSIPDVRHKLVYNHQVERGDGQIDYRLIDLDTVEERRNDVLYNEMKSERDRAEEILRSLDE